MLGCVRRASGGIIYGVNGDLIRHTRSWWARGEGNLGRGCVVRVFDAVEEAEAAVGRSFAGVLSVDSLADALGVVRTLLGEEYAGVYLAGETASRVFVAVRRPVGYVFYLVEDGPRFWDAAVRIA